jgi:hypothetical protein
MPILKRHSKEELELKEQEYWHRALRMGKSKFVWRTAILGYVLPWLLVWTPLFCLFTHRLTLYNIALTAIVCLPICMLTGYMNAAHRWKQMLAKHGG